MSLLGVCCGVGGASLCPYATMSLIPGSVLCGVISATCDLIAVNTCNSGVRPCGFRFQLTFEITVLSSPFYYRKFQTRTRVYWNEPKIHITCQNTFRLRTSFCHLRPHPLLPWDVFTGRITDVTSFHPRVFENISLFKHNHNSVITPKRFTMDSLNLSNTQSMFKFPPVFHFPETFIGSLFHSLIHRC